MKHLVLNILARIFGYDFSGTIGLANINEGTHADSITKLSDAAFSLFHLLCKFGTDVDHIALNTASDKPLGVCDDDPDAAEEEVAVQLLGTSNRTRLVVASEIIAYNADLYTADDGKVQNEPEAAGTYYKVGRAMQAAAADEDVIEMEPCQPLKYVVSE